MGKFIQDLLNRIAAWLDLMRLWRGPELRGNGKHIEIVAPLNNETRQKIEKKVFSAHQIIADEPVTGHKLKVP